MQKLRLPRAIVCCSRSTVTGVSGSAAIKAPSSADVRFRQDGSEKPVLDRVLCEDVAEGRRDHAAETGLIKRIDGRFARRAAAEIAAGDEDPGVAPDRPIQRKVGFLVAVGVAAQIVEQNAPELRRARQFQIARRQNLIGVDIGEQQRTALWRCGERISPSRSALNLSPGEQRPHVGKMAADRGGGDHGRRHQVRARTPGPAGRGNCGWWSRRSVRRAARCRR